MLSNSAQENIPLCPMDAFHAQEYEPSSDNLRGAYDTNFSPIGSTGQAGGETIYELHPIPTHLSERARRPPILAGNTDKSSEPISHSDNITDYNTTQRSTTKEQTRSSLIHFVALCWCSWLIGWNDGTTGPLLPRIQERYNVCVHEQHYRWYNCDLTFERLVSLWCPWFSLGVVL